MIQYAILSTASLTLFNQDILYMVKKGVSSWVYKGNNMALL